MKNCQEKSEKFFRTFLVNICSRKSSFELVRVYGLFLFVGDGVGDGGGDGIKRKITKGTFLCTSPPTLS